jgi:exosome complex component RRP46
VLALLSAAMPLATTATSTLLAIMDDGLAKKFIQNPTVREIQQAISLHVLAFTSHGDLIVAESEGDFTIDEWDEVFEKAQHICCGVRETGDVDAMLDEGGEEIDGGLRGFLRSTLQDKVTSDLKWRK